MKKNLFNSNQGGNSMNSKRKLINYLKDKYIGQSFKSGIYANTDDERLFTDLRYVKQIELCDWSIIVELGLLTLEEKNSLAYKDLLRLFEKLFRTKNMQLKDKSEKDILNIIHDILLNSSDGLLLSKELKQDYDDLVYLNTACSSCYGEALTCLIEYASWQYLNKKDVSDIIPILDKLLAESEYEETWTVLGCYLVKIYVVFEDWMRENINRIFPEEDEAKFNIAWITYIISNKCYSELFILLKNKFEYVLKNKLYIKNKDYLKSLGRHCVYILCVYDEDLDNEIIKLIFDIPELLGDMIHFIGNALKCPPISQEIIDRFKRFWERAKISGCSNIALSGFQYWYTYGYRYFDREWAVDQLYDLIVKRRVKIDYCLFISWTKEVLLKDLCVHVCTPKVFKIIETIYLNINDFDMITDVDIIEDVVKYIKENHTELKNEKDKFIRELYRRSEVFNNPDRMRESLNRLGKYAG
jgi:hypothetical protein